MTLQQLRYIVALDEERHFSRAAEKCMVSQPGLTIQLKNIEEEIGMKIFDRAKNPIAPTQAGTEIIRRARKILREADDLRNFVVSEKNMLKGEVKLGVISTLAPYLIPLIIADLNRELPDIHFTIWESTTYHLVNDLESGAIDIALMSTPIGSPDLKEYPVFSEPFVAYLNDSHLMKNEASYQLSETDSEDLLLLQSEFCYNSQLLEICNPARAQKTPKGFSYGITSVETLKSLSRAGLGFAIVPALSVLNEKENSFIKHFSDPQPVREISLVVRETFSRKLLLEKISGVIWEKLPPELKHEKDYQKIRWNDSPYFAKFISGE